MKRKYIGIPTQEEVIKQFKELKAMIKDIITYEQIQEFIDNNPHNGSHIDIEINHDIMKYFNKKDEIEVIRYEYKNILIYHYIKSGIDEEITVYNDDGDYQFAECKYYEFDKKLKQSEKINKFEEVDREKVVT